MRPILGLLFFIFMLFLNEIETSHLGRLNLGSYSEEDEQRIAQFGTSRVGSTPLTRNLMPQPEPRAWYDGLNLHAPPPRRPHPNTDLQLGLPGSGKKKKQKKRTSRKEVQEPPPEHNPLHQFANDIEHLDKMIPSPEGPNHGNYHPQTYQQSQHYYGLPDASTHMGHAGGSGSANHALYQERQGSPSEDPYQQGYPTYSRPRKYN